VSTHPPLIGPDSPVIGRVARIAHLVEICGGLGSPDTARRDVKHLDEHDGGDPSVTEPDGTADAAATARHHVPAAAAWETAAARVPSCSWADQSIPAAC
jgi:hypothetical protein